MVSAHQSPLHSELRLSLSAQFRQGFEHLAHGVVGFNRVPQWTAEINCIGVPPPIFRLQYVTGRDQVADDSMRGPLADPDTLCDLGDSYIRVLGNANENMTVICQKRPLRFRATGLRLGDFWHQTIIADFPVLFDMTSITGYALPETDNRTAP